MRHLVLLFGLVGCALNDRDETVSNGQHGQLDFRMPAAADTMPSLLVPGTYEVTVHRQVIHFDDCPISDCASSGNTIEPLDGSTARLVGGGTIDSTFTDDKGAFHVMLTAEPGTLTLEIDGPYFDARPFDVTPATGIEVDSIARQGSLLRGAVFSSKAELTPKLFSDSISANGPVEIALTGGIAETDVDFGTFSTRHSFAAEQPGDATIRWFHPLANVELVSQTRVVDDTAVVSAEIYGPEIGGQILELTCPSTFGGFGDFVIDLRDGAGAQIFGGFERLVSSNPEVATVQLSGGAVNTGFQIRCAGTGTTQIRATFNGLEIGANVTVP